MLSIKPEPPAAAAAAASPVDSTFRSAVSACVNQPERRKPCIKMAPEKQLFSRSGAGLKAGGGAPMLPLSGNKKLGADWAGVIIRR